jgi:hypothetical protein
MKIPKIIPLDSIERTTYKFVENMKFKYIHPYGPPQGVTDQIFTMHYTGVTLNGRPHGMGILELKDPEREDESRRYFTSYLKFKFYGQFIDGEITGGPALL